MRGLDKIHGHQSLFYLILIYLISVCQSLHLKKNIKYFKVITFPQEKYNHKPTYQI